MRDDEDIVPIEYPSGLSFFGDSLQALVPTGEDLKAMMTAAGVAGGSIVAASMVIPKLPIQNKWLRRGIVAALGVVGGNLLGRKNRDAGIGLAAGLIGMSVASVVAEVMKKPISLDSFEMSAEEEEVRRELTDIEIMPEEAALMNLPEDLSQVDTEVEHRLGEAVGVETERRLSGMDDMGYQVGVETEQKLGWIG